MMKIYTIVAPENYTIAIDLVMSKLKITSTGIYGSTKHEDVNGEVRYYTRRHAVMGIFSYMRFKLALKFLNWGDRELVGDIKPLEHVYIWANKDGIENDQLCFNEIPEETDQCYGKGKHER